MAMRRRSLAFLAVIALLGGCAAPRPVPPPARAYWIPASDVSFTTLDRHTHYTFVPGEWDVLIYEDEAPHARRTWLVRVPSGSPSDTTLVITRESDARAWLVEHPRNLPAHVAGAIGVVTLHGRHADGATATVSLEAHGRQRSPGEVRDPTITFSRRLDWARTTRPVAEPGEPRTRGGLAPDDDR